MGKKKYISPCPPHLDYFALAGRVLPFFLSPDAWLVGSHRDTSKMPVSASPLKGSSTSDLRGTTTLTTTTSEQVHYF